MNKIYINIILFSILFFVLSKIVSIKNKESFIISKLNLLPINIKKNFIFKQGDEGDSGNFSSINMNDVFIEGKLNLGKNKILNIPNNETNSSELGQLTLSKNLSQNGVKLHINTKGTTDNTYFIFCENNEKELGMYLNNKQLKLNGDLEIENGTIGLNDMDGNLVKLPNDFIPEGTIFPFYINLNGIKNITTGEYIIKKGTTYLKNDVNIDFSATDDDQASHIFLKKVENNLYTLALLEYNSELEILEYKYLNYSPANNFSFDKKIQQFRLERQDSTDTSKPYKFNLKTADNETISDFKNIEFVGAIPYGWEKCNGDNNHDLTDKFIVHEDTNTYIFGTDGGQETITLDESNLPEHTHDIISLEKHSHTIRMTPKPGHNHTILDSQFNNNQGGLTNNSIIRMTHFPQSNNGVNNNCSSNNDCREGLFCNIQGKCRKCHECLTDTVEGIDGTCGTCDEFKLLKPSDGQTNNNSHGHGLTITEDGKHIHHMVTQTPIPTATCTGNGNGNPNPNPMCINIEPNYIKIIYIMKK